MRKFKDLTIWKDGIQIVKAVYHVTASLPSEEKYGLKSQMTRAAISIPSNIAEGCSRKSQKDFSRFLEIALGSAFELESQVIILEELRFGEKEKLQNLNKLIIKLQRQLNSLKLKLTANSK